MPTKKVSTVGRRVFIAGVGALTVGALGRA